MTGAAGRSPYAVTPRRVEKPWGWELVWAETEAYVGKLLFVRAGQSLSLQYHEVKDEAWLVQEGRGATAYGLPPAAPVTRATPGGRRRTRPHA